MALFQNLTLRGIAGAVTWGYMDAAALRAWSIRKNVDNPDWTLTGTVASFDKWRVRQGPLFFNAPRPGGYWCWPVRGQLQIDGQRVTCRLGHPEY